MAFFPDTYKPDLEYLVDLLIPLCATLPPGVAAPDLAAEEAIRNLAQEIGEKQLAEILATWFVRTDVGGVR